MRTQTLSCDLNSLNTFFLQVMYFTSSFELFFYLESTVWGNFPEILKKMWSAICWCLFSDFCQERKKFKVHKSIVFIKKDKVKIMEANHLKEWAPLDSITFDIMLAVYVTPILLYYMCVCIYLYLVPYSFCYAIILMTL